MERLEFSFILKSNAFSGENRKVENYKAQLIFVNQTFLKFSLQKGAVMPSEKAMAVLIKSLFYDAQKNEWANPHLQSPRTKLDLLKTQNDFHEKKWILLKKESEKYIQEGPYSSFEIFEMLRRSELRLEDPIWKEGFSRWMPIKTAPTFKELETLSKPLEADVADILSSVVEYNPEMHRVEKKDPLPENSSEFFLILDDPFDNKMR